MVRVVIRTGKDGLLRSADVSGHAGFADTGTDIVCASITAIARSAARILDLNEHIEVTGAAQEPGALSFRVLRFDAGTEEYIRGVTDFLVLGLGDIAREYPDHCYIELNKERYYGT